MSQIGVATEYLRFTFAGHTVLDTHCASDLNMLDQDIIYVKHEPAFFTRVKHIPSDR